MNITELYTEKKYASRILCEVTLTYWEDDLYPSHFLREVIVRTSDMEDHRIEIVLGPKSEAIRQTIKLMDELIAKYFPETVQVCA